MTKYEIEPFSKEDLPEANELLSGLSTEERLKWSKQTFGEGLWGLTSGGIDSPVLLDLVQKTDLGVDFVHINTGVQAEEIFPFLARVGDVSETMLHTFAARWGEVSDARAAELFDEDPERYKEVTKLEPLRRAIHKLGITALLSGIRSDQTDNRASLDYIMLGNNGEFRIHPILDWSKEEIRQYKEQENLPRHPLSNDYGSLGDRIHTTPGEDREGRGLAECGLHLNLRSE